MAVDTIIRKKFPIFSKNKFFKTKIGKMVSILITQFLIFFAFIAFRVRDIDDMVYSMEKYLIWDLKTEGTITVSYTHLRAN